MTHRRTFLCGLTLGTLAAPLAAKAQQTARVYRIGILTAGPAETLRQTLRDLGYLEGRNVVLEIRDTEGKPERANDLALQLARLRVDVIVATHPAAVLWREARDGNDPDCHGAYTGPCPIGPRD